MKKWIDAVLNRFYDLLLSIYVFNEQRGFIYLDQLAEAFEEKYPEEKVIIAAVRKHARDERKHYLLFCEYFLNRQVWLFEIDYKFGV